MAIECRVVQAPAPPHVYLSGAIDEHTDLDKVFADLQQVRPDPLILNLEGILRINSIGLRHWIPLVSQLSKSRTVVVEALSYPFVIQANNVANLLAGVEIRSCVAPYYCSLCEMNRTIVVSAEEIRAGELAPPKDCPECGTEMEFDELEDYFAFLRRGR